MRGVKVLFEGALMLACLPVLVTAAEPPKPQPSVAQLRDAQNAINRQTADVNRGADALPADIKKTNDQLDRLNKNFDKEIKPKLKRAKDKADEAAKAAKDAKAAAEACDKAKFQRLSKRAEDLMKESRDASRSAEDQATPAQKLDSHTRNLQGDKPIADAVGDGLSETSDAVQAYQRAQARVRKQLDEQKENLDKVDKGQRDLNQKMTKAKKDLDSSQPLNQAESDLQDGAAWLAENCPPKTSAVPKETTDMFVSVNNQPEIVACIAPGQNAREAANRLGLGQHQLIAAGPAGTIIRAPGNAETVNRRAAEQRITLCFPAEADVCIIMTPLTAFRGHNHEAHIQSNRAVHDHEAPDPLWEWGVTPPETAIRWD
jgi:hypothetical protein